MSETLTPVDTVWLHMEQPTNLMMVTAVLMFAGRVDFERFKKTYEYRLLAFERFRQRVVESAVPLRAPHWEHDPDFDIDSHIHRMALPASRSKTSLLSTIGDLASTPLDFSKPLWQVHLIENYRGGSVAVMRFHHCIADGTAMVGVTSRLMDERPDAALAPPSRDQRRGQAGRTPLGALLRPLGAGYQLSKKLAGAIIKEGVESLLHPVHLFELAEAAWRGAGTVGHALLMPADPPTPFKGKLGVQKHVAWSDPVPLEQVKRLGKQVDAKVNDVLLAAMTGALRYYLLRRKVPVKGLNLRAVIPVDLRKPEHALELGNQFGLVFVSLPIDIANPVERLLELKRRMDAIKRSPEPYVFFGLLNVFGLTPKQLEDQIVNLFGRRATVVMTNVVGPHERLYMAGTPIDNLMFWVPQSGRLGVGISILSYDGKVTLGVITDAGLVPDPASITRRFRTELGRILDATGGGAPAGKGS